MFLRYSDFKDGMQFKNSLFFEITHDINGDKNNGGVFFPGHVFTFKEKQFSNLIFDTGDGFDIELTVKHFIKYGFLIVNKSKNQIYPKRKPLYNKKLRLSPKNTGMTDYEMQLYLQKKGVDLYNGTNQIKIDILINEAVLRNFYWDDIDNLWRKYS